MTSFNNREKRGSQLDGKQYVFTFVPQSGHHLPYYFLFLNGLTSSSSINPGIPVEAFSHSCPILLTIWDYCYGNGYYPENQTGTRGGQEHIAHLGIRIIPQ